jgi:hypothetical protein
MMTKLGKERIKELGLKEPGGFPWGRYSVKPKPGSWVQKLTDEGEVEYISKGEVPE